MTRQKDLKRLVRARMQKTGEAYTTARMQILGKSGKAGPSLRSGPQEEDYAALAGISDEKVKAATGCGWAKWVKALDHYGAHEMTHRDIAKLIKEKYHTPAWWTQTVAVGYERIKGLRAKGQQRNGTFQMTKSKTFNVPLEVLYDAWTSATSRKRWLEGARLRTSKANKHARLDVDDATVVANFTAKGTKSLVAVEREKLPDREAVARAKELWTERLRALEQALNE